MYKELLQEVVEKHNNSNPKERWELEIKKEYVSLDAFYVLVKNEASDGVLEETLCRRTLLDLIRVQNTTLKQYATELQKQHN
jgi:hypothetical protein